MEIVLQASCLALIGLLAYAAISDLMTMTIPNRISLALIGLFLMVVPFSGAGMATIGWHVAVGLVMLAVTFTLFNFGVFGGGDAKLAAAIALWMGPASVDAFVLHMAIFGGLLALVFVVLRRLPMPAAATRPAWSRRLLDPAGGIPYGIAIAAGALVVLPETIWGGILR